MDAEMLKEQYEAILSEVHKKHEIEKSSLLEEQKKDKAAIAGLETKLKEVEQKLVCLENLSELRDKFQKIPLEGRHGEVLDKQKQVLREQRVADQEHLIRALKLNLGFQGGKPVAAVVIFKSFVHWKAMQQERGTIFDKVSEAIGLQIEAYQDDNEGLGYWLTNTAALYYLMQRHTKPAGTVGDNGITARLRISGQQAATGFLSYFGRYPDKLVNSDGTTPRDGQDSVVQYEARYPALLFKHGLGALVQTILPSLRDNIKREMSTYLGMCLNISADAHGERSAGRGKRNEDKNDDYLLPWREILRILNGLLIILRENHVPHILASKLVEQLFNIINCNLFNQLMLKRDCCSFSEGENVKMGLAEVEHWLLSSGAEWVGGSWEKLSHLRQAVAFLVIHQKARKTLDEIRNDICPSLTVQQIYRLSTMYWDDRFGTGSVSDKVLTQMKAVMTSGAQDTETKSFLLDEYSTFPFTTDELETTYDGLALLDSLVEIPPELLNDHDSKDKFAFLVRNLSAEGSSSPSHCYNTGSYNMN